MISYVKSYATTYGTSVKEEMMVQITAFVKQLFNNKELWITVIAFAICLLVVYSIRRLAIDNSWAIGIVAGAVVHIIVMALGNVVMNTHISYVAVILGSVAATLIGLVAELFVFSVDYSRTEHLQFEDDEYYYYVKAVPKVSVSAPEKTVKRINERQETSMDVTGRQKRGARRNSEDMVKEQTDEMLLAKTLQDELDIQKIIEDELKF